VRAPHEKGKVEKGAIHYIRHNFFPLRSFKDLDDVQSQAIRWRDTVANARVHTTTGEKPSLRFKPEAMIPLPETLPDCRDTEVAKVHTDFSIRFDANTYTVPPSLIGKELVVKADRETVTIYCKDKAVAVHKRSWLRRHRSESPRHLEAAGAHRCEHWLSGEAAYLLSLGEEVKVYMEHLAALHLPLKKNLDGMIALRDEYGAQALVGAVREAAGRNAYGADYIRNILYQRMRPCRLHPPVKLDRDALNRIRLDEPSLADFDAFVVKRRKHHE
jgi:hypothetical protein